MKAIVTKPLGRTLVVGDEYPVVAINGSNIVILQDGFETGFSDQYLRVVDENQDRRKELVSERDEIEREIGKLKARLASVQVEIMGIDFSCQNQTRMVL